MPDIDFGAIRQFRDAAQAVVAASTQTASDLTSLSSGAISAQRDVFSASSLASQASGDTPDTDSSGVGRQLQEAVANLSSEVSALDAQGAAGEISDCGSKLADLSQQLNEFLPSVPAGPVQVALQQALFQLGQASLQETGPNGAQFQEGQVGSALGTAGFNLSSAGSDANAIAGDSPGENVSDYGRSATRELNGVSSALSNAGRAARSSASDQQAVTTDSNSAVSSLNQALSAPQTSGLGQFHSEEGREPAQG